MQLSKNPKNKLFMSLKIKIAERLKAKAAGVNLSQKRIDAIVARAEKGLTDDSDDAAIDANLEAINELTPFKDIAALDDHERAKAKKLADEKEAARLKAIEDGKLPPIDDDPNESSTDKLLKALIAKVEKQDQVLASFGQEKVTTTRKQQLEEKLKDVDPKFKATALKAYDRMKFDKDEDFESYLTEISEDAKEFVVQEFQSDRPTGSAGRPNTKQASDKEVDAVVDSLI